MIRRLKEIETQQKSLPLTKIETYKANYDKLQEQFKLSLVFQIKTRALGLNLSLLS